MLEIKKALEYDGESPFIKQIREFEAMTPQEREERRAAVRAVIETEQRQERETRIREIIRECGLGERFLKRTFDTFRPDEYNRGALAYCKNYAANFDRQEKGLYLWGSYGVGKTHLAAAIANHLMLEGKTVIFLPITTLKDRIYKSYSNYTTDEIIDRVCRAQLVILDDFDKLNPTDNIKEVLFGLINRLYEAERKAVITANSNRSDLDAIYGGSIASRIAEMCAVFELEGRDKRV